MQHEPSSSESCRPQDGESTGTAPADLDEWCTSEHLGRWQQGDPAGFRAVYDRFARLLHARIRRNRVWPMLEGRIQLEDAAQEVWARAIPAIEQGFCDRGSGSFLAFLGKIADRTIVDLVRMARAEKRGGGMGAQSLRTEWERRAQLTPGRSGVETPTGHARSAELQRIARDALSERELEAWEMVEIAGYSAEEAGLAMRCTGSAVRGLLLRSRAKLIARLQECESR